MNEAQALSTARTSAARQEDDKLWMKSGDKRMTAGTVNIANIFQ